MSSGYWANENFEPCVKSLKVHSVKEQTLPKSGGGFFPRQRFDKAHTEFFTMLNFPDVVMILQDDIHVSKI